MYSFDSLYEFYNKKKVLITGHTGFKGSWLCKILLQMGAKVIGYALESPTNPALFNMLEFDKNYPNSFESYIADIRNLSALREVFSKEQPEIVIHMAAQPIVRTSYENPVGTYDINVMGTVNVLECCRLTPSVKSVVNVTTDKVYRNNEWDRGYVESDYLDGYDPYSNSKSCSELVTHSYIQSFFSEERNLPVSTCRAGNVLGGGDFAKDRIIPDCYRAAETMNDILVRNPYSTRPYQHVLDPLFAYLMVAKEQYLDIKIAGAYNVGPDDESCVNTGDLVDKFVGEWNKVAPVDCEGGARPELKWINKSDDGPHEAKFLKLDCNKLKTTFDWKPVWNIDTTMKQVVGWYSIYLSNGDINVCMERQIREFVDSFKR